MTTDTPNYDGLKEVTPLEAFCLATAIATYLTLSDPDAADVITRLADNIHTVLAGGADADAE